MARLSQSEVANFDEFIERLSKCKLLSEPEVKVLCDKAKYLCLHPERSWPRSPTWRPCAPP